MRFNLSISKEDVTEALRKCYDPEIPVNIVDLGLVYDLKIEGNAVYVKMTLTMQGCPAHEYLKQQVEEELLKVRGVSKAEVEIVWDPPWTPERLTEEGRKALDAAQKPAISLTPFTIVVRSGSEATAEGGNHALVNSVGQTFLVSEHQLAVWKTCDGRRNVREVAEKVASEFGFNAEQILDQVMQMLSEFAAAGLVSQEELVQMDTDSVGLFPG